MRPQTHSTQIRLSVVQLLNQKRNQLLAYAYAMTHDHHLAEDIYQEVSMIVAEAPDKIPSDPKHAHNWLKQITRRKSLELGRKDRKLKRNLQAEIVDVCFNEFEQESDYNCNRRALMGECLEKLKQDAKAVVTARYLDEQDCDAIAQHVGRTVQSVYAILKRARSALVKCMNAKLRIEQHEH